jgi:cysteine-S-conjugate beta-lyase
LPSQFDQVISRRHTASVKWDLQDFQGVLPMWVADMDFACPEVILEAIKTRVDHGIFGYSLPPQGLMDITIERLQNRYNYAIQPEWLVWLPGLETALTLASLALTSDQEACMCFDPIYPPFYTGPRKAGRSMVRLPFLKTSKGWELDWEQLEAHFIKSRVKLLFRR